MALRYGVQYDNNFNLKKSVQFIISRTKEYKKQKFPLFFLADQELEVMNKVRYLGHINRSNLCCKLYAQANMLAGKFNMFTDDAEIALFKAYCTLYCIPYSPFVVQLVQQKQKTFRWHIMIHSEYC